MDVCLDRYYRVLDTATAAGIAPAPLQANGMQMMRSRLIALARVLKLTLKK
jgi:hypothetical protein